MRCIGRTAAARYIQQYDSGRVPVCVCVVCASQSADCAWPMRFTRLFVRPGKCKCFLIDPNPKW